MADLIPEAKACVQALLDHLESTEVQRRLRPGFERDFSNSILEQWERSEWMSEKQQYWLGEIVGRYTSGRQNSSR